MQSTLLKVDTTHKLLSNEYGNFNEKWLAMKKEYIAKIEYQIKKLLGKDNYNK